MPAFFSYRATRTNLGGSTLKTLSNPNLSKPQFQTAVVRSWFTLLIPHGRNCISTHELRDTPTTPRLQEEVRGSRTARFSLQGRRRKALSIGPQPQVLASFVPHHSMTSSQVPPSPPLQPATTPRDENSPYFSHKGLMSPFDQVPLQT